MMLCGILSHIDTQGSERFWLFLKGLRCVCGCDHDGFRGQVSARFAALRCNNAD